MISCAYCGGGHATPAEVKACWARSQGAEAAAAPAAPAAVPAAGRPAPRTMADLHDLLWSPDLGGLDGPGEPPPWRAPADTDCPAELAPDQLAAVTHAGGSARIIAPAGSGKTRVLTERARHLVTRWKVPTAALTVVAYNKRAQEEVVARTADLPGLQVRTLNALALAIVNGRPPFAPQAASWRMLDEREVRAMLGRLVTVPRKLNADPLAPWLDALSVARLGLADPAHVEAQFGGDVKGFAAVFDTLRAQFAQQRVLDFDEQILRAIELLCADPAARGAAQAACRVLLVDEFQDLTPAHLLLVRLLSGGGGHVFAVGDDDQTIYGYNGADPRWLIDFADWFPGAGDHPLEVNYRCPAGIVDAADRLLRHNQRRVPKTIRAADGAEPGGWRALGGSDPVSTTVTAVQTALADGAASDVAVLARVNVALVPVRVALGLAGVPVRSGPESAFAGTTSVRSVLAWLRLATGGEFDPDDLDEALRRPSRSLHPTIRSWATERRTVSGLQQLAGKLTKPKEAEAVAAFAHDIARVRAVAERGTTEEVVNVVVSEIGLGSAVGGLDAGKHGTNSPAQSDSLQAVLQLARLHPTPATFERWLHDQLARPSAPDGVTLATVHKVKGQEWPQVVVHLADADQFPHRLADDREEERRLFHVAITRASRQATLVSGPEPSPFVAELTAEPPDLQAVKPGPAPVGHAGGDLVTKLAKSRPADALEGADRARFERLREWRRGAADGKPAYTVFDDKTLAGIAQSGAADLAGLARVRGVGPAKLEQYGAQVLAVLSAALDDPAHSAGA